MNQKYHHSSNNDKSNNIKDKLPSLDEIFQNNTSRKIRQFESKYSVGPNGIHKLLPSIDNYPNNNNSSCNHNYPPRQPIVPPGYFLPSSPPAYARIKGHHPIPYSDNRVSYSSELIPQRQTPVSVASSSPSFSQEIPQDNNVRLVHHRSLPTSISLPGPTLATMSPSSQMDLRYPPPMISNFNCSESQVFPHIGTNYRDAAWCPVTQLPYQSQYQYVDTNLPYPPYPNENYGTAHYQNPLGTSTHYANRNFTEPKISHFKYRTYSQKSMKEGMTHRKKRHNIPKEITKILLGWLGEHLNNPYPTNKEKMELSEKTKLTIQQLDTWFINTRKRKIKEMKKNLKKPD